MQKSSSLSHTAVPASPTDEDLFCNTEDTCSLSSETSQPPLCDQEAGDDSDAQFGSLPRDLVTGDDSENRHTPSTTSVLSWPPRFRRIKSSTKFTTHTPPAASRKGKSTHRKSMKSVKQHLEDLCSPLNELVNPANPHSALSLALQDTRFNSLSLREKNVIAEQAMLYFLNHPETVQSPVEIITQNILPQLKNSLCRFLPQLTTHLGEARQESTDYLVEFIIPWIEPIRTSRKPEDLQHAQAFDQFLAEFPHLSDLLSKSWYEQPEYSTLDYQGYHDRINRCQTAIQSIIPYIGKKYGVVQQPDVAVCLTNDLKAISEQLQTLLQVSQSNERSDFRTKTEWHNLIGLMQLTASEAASHLAPERGRKHRTANAVITSLNNICQKATKKTPGRAFISYQRELESSILSALQPLGDSR